MQVTRTAARLSLVVGRQNVNMKTIVQRMLDSVIAIVMILLSLVFQAFFFLFLGWGFLGILELAGREVESDAVAYAVMGAAFLLFNVLTFFVYFKKAQADVGVGRVSSIFFFLPRAIDTILYGSQRVSRSEGVSDINPRGTEAQPTAQRDREDAR